jgi:hypothetical protein
MCDVLGLKPGEEERVRSFVAMFFFRDGCMRSSLRLLFGVTETSMLALRSGRTIK